MSWRYVLFLLGIHTPAAATELLDITLTRQWEGGLLGFMLEQSAMGQLIAELSPGTPADVDGSLLPGDVIIGAEGLAEGRGGAGPGARARRERGRGRGRGREFRPR